MRTSSVALTNMFFYISVHADGELQAPEVEPKVPKHEPRRDLSGCCPCDFDLALGVRRRHAPTSCEHDYCGFAHTL